MNSRKTIEVRRFVCTKGEKLEYATVSTFQDGSAYIEANGIEIIYEGHSTAYQNACEYLGNLGFTELSNGLNA